MLMQTFSYILSCPDVCNYSRLHASTQDTLLTRAKQDRFIEFHSCKSINNINQQVKTYLHVIMYKSLHSKNNFSI